MSAELCYNYHWHKLSDEMYPRIIREFLDNGVRHFVFSDPQIREALKNPDFLMKLRGLVKKMQVEFVAMHAPFGPDFDLNITEKERRGAMIREHIRAMEIAAEFGSRTYTIHVGAHHHCTLHVPVPELRENAIASLEELVPAAERVGIVLAVENSFEPTNSAKEVNRLVRTFAGSPAIGVCYDTGHANFMAPAPWKRPEKYPEYQKKAWWEHGITEEDGAEELLHDQIVTVHMHDNDGYGDLHAMPGDGTIDWQELLPKLRRCPRMLEYQTEVNLIDGKNWAGISPAPVGGYSIRRLVDTFRKLGF